MATWPSSNEMPGLEMMLYNIDCCLMLKIAKVCKKKNFCNVNKQLLGCGAHLAFGGIIRRYFPPGISG